MALAPTRSDGVQRGNHHSKCGKGKKAVHVQVDTSQDRPCDELFLDAVICGFNDDALPDDVIVDTICAPHTNEANTSV